jgi:hypothetical protein
LLFQANRQYMKTGSNPISLLASCP